MKVILTGATGLVGGAVLQNLISNPAITSIIVLSRRELSTKDANKVKTIIIKDFLNYEPHVLTQLEGAEVCIWALGSATSGKDVHHDMTFAATEAFLESCVPKLQNGKEFRFVYTSGALAVQDQKAQTWYLSDMRKLRGAIETKILDLQNQHAGSWTSYIVRPALVTTGEPFYRLLLSGFYVPKEELAATMVDLAVNGGEQQILDNGDIRSKGKAALTQK